MLIRERLGRIRGKFKGGPGALGVFAASTGSPRTPQLNPAPTLLRAQAPSPSSVPGAQLAPPHIEYHIVPGRNATRAGGLRADVREVSQSEDLLCEPIDNRGDSAPLSVPSLRLAVPSPVDPATHASVPIANPTSPPAYTSIGGADNSPGQAAGSEPVVQVAPLANDDVSNCPDVAGKDRIDRFDATPATPVIPANREPISASTSRDVGHTAQATSPSLGLSSAVSTSSSATSGAADATAALQLTNRTYAYLAEWDTRPLFPLYILSIFVLLIPLIL